MILRRSKAYFSLILLLSHQHQFDASHDFLQTKTPGLSPVTAKQGKWGLTEVAWAQVILLAWIPGYQRILQPDCKHIYGHNIVLSEPMVPRHGNNIVVICSPANFDQCTAAAGDLRRHLQNWKLASLPTNAAAAVLSSAAFWWGKSYT